MPVFWYLDLLATLLVDRNGFKKVILSWEYEGLAKCQIFKIFSLIQ